MLTTFALWCGITEAMSVSLYAFLYLMLPVSPGKVQGEPQETGRIIQLWVVSIFFECTVTTIVAASLSRARHRRMPEKCGDLTLAWGRHARPVHLTAGIIVVLVVVEQQFIFINSLCVAQKPASLSVLSLGRCP